MDHEHRAVSRHECPQTTSKPIRNGRGPPSIGYSSIAASTRRLSPVTEDDVFQVREGRDSIARPGKVLCFCKLVMDNDAVNPGRHG